MARKNVYRSSHVNEEFMKKGRMQSKEFLEEEVRVSAESEKVILKIKVPILTDLKISKMSKLTKKERINTVLEHLRAFKMVIKIKGTSLPLFDFKEGDLFILYQSAISNSVIDEQGKEKYQFFTDSNGLKMMKRQFDPTIHFYGEKDSTLES